MGSRGYTFSIQQFVDCRHGKNAHLIFILKGNSIFSGYSALIINFTWAYPSPESIVNRNMALTSDRGTCVSCAHENKCWMVANASFVTSLVSCRNESTVIWCGRCADELGCVGDGGGVAVTVCFGFAPTRAVGEKNIAITISI